MLDLPDTFPLKASCFLLWCCSTLNSSNVNLESFCYCYYYFECLFEESAAVAPLLSKTLLWALSFSYCSLFCLTWSVFYFEFRRLNGSSFSKDLFLFKISNTELLSKPKVFLGFWGCFPCAVSRSTGFFSGVGSTVLGVSFGIMWIDS